MKDTVPNAAKFFRFRTLLVKYPIHTWSNNIENVIFVLVWMNLMKKEKIFREEKRHEFNGHFGILFLLMDISMSFGQSLYANCHSCTTGRSILLANQGGTHIDKCIKVNFWYPRVKTVTLWFSSCVSRRVGRASVRGIGFFTFTMRTLSLKHQYEYHCRSCWFNILPDLTF